MSTELHAFLAKVKSAKTCEDVFGSFTGAIVKYDDARSLYLRFARLTHVDHYVGTSDEPVATEAFSLLSSFWQEAEQKLKDGTYGKTVAPRTLAAVIASKKEKYTVTAPFAGGDLSNLYRATSDDGKQVLLKVARHPVINDLLMNEASALKRLKDGVVPATSWGDYFPEFIDAFRVKDAKGVTKHVTVLKWRDGFFPLTEIVAQYPRGVDPRHFVWIFKRLLSVLGYAHDHQKLLHGAVLPTHVLVRPENHGLMLVDWSYAAELAPPASDCKVQALSPGYRSFYPTEVLKKHHADQGVDIWMAAKCMEYIVGGSDVLWLARGFRNFLDGCLIPNPARRPINAFNLYDQFRALAEEVYGKPKWVDLVLTV